MVLQNATNRAPAVGTIASQNANAIAITGGSVTNLNTMSVFAQAGTNAIIGANWAQANNTNVFLRFGDQYNIVATGFSKNFIYRAFHGFDFYGGGELSAPVVPGASSNGSYNSRFYSSNSAQKTLQVVCASGQSANPFEVTNNALSAIFAITPGGGIRPGANSSAIASVDSTTTNIASPGASWSFAWAKALVGDPTEIIPKNGSAIPVSGRCSTAGTVLADTSTIASGTSIEIRIIRTIA